ncbi:MAG: TonB-dependent receptor [Gammaproteobacteria bacterium]|nr:TonB-dependent receptor [Gammaproteobacteria bacterium]
MAAGFVMQGHSLLAVACTALVLGAGTGMGNQALAQTAKARGALDEIIVTTTKREETLQDVPISVGVVTGKAVEEFGMQGFEEVQNHVPNLVIQETLGSYQIRIRGLGSGASQLSFVSAVGTFVDGVYCGRPRCFQNPLFDIERIEVVRGPQGALFGKNTIAGAVSTISKGPTDDLYAEVSTGVELAEGGYNLSGIVSGPISDTLGFRVAAKHENLDGYIKNTSTGKDENAVDANLVRGILDWNPTENLKVRLKAEVADRDYDGYTTQLLALGGYGTALPFSMPEAFDHKTSTNVIYPDGQFDRTDSANYALQVDWQLGGGYTLTSITGAIGFDFKRRTTAVGYKQLFVDTQITEDYEQYSQELRFLSPTGGFFDYVVGLYYSEDDSRISQLSPFVAPAFVPDPPGSGTPNDPNTKTYTGSDRAYHGEGDTLSAYASGTFHFFDDRLRTILGIRVGEDTLDGNSTNTNGRYDRATNTWIWLPDYTYLPIGALNKEFDISSSRDERYTLPSVTLQYDMTDEVMLYASYAKGFKGGGFIANDATTGNNVLAKAAADPAWALEYAGMSTINDVQLHDGITLKENNGVYDYKPEKANSYEIGAKMNFLGGGLSWNVALFRTEFENLQTSQYDGVRFITRNAAEATSQGVETDVQWLVNDNLTLGLNAAYNDAKYDTYKNTFCKVIDIQGTLAVPGCVNGQGDLSGERIDRAPEYSGSLTIDWESPLTAGTLLRVNGAMTYSDDYFIQANMSPLYEQDAFTKYDLRVAVADVDDSWEVALIGRNLSDELTLQHAFQVSVFHAASVSTPRYVTLQGTMKFH